MPYPYQISSTAWMPDPIFNPGPFNYSTSLYVTLHDRTNNHVEIWKSTDSGVNWSEVDSANHPSVRSSDQAIDTHRSGNTLYILYTPSAGATLAIIPFDLTTDTWGTPITGGPTTTAQHFHKVVKRSGGTYVVIWTDLDGGYRRINAVTYSGSWSSTTVLLDPGTTDYTTYEYWLISVVIDASDHTYVLASTASSGGNIRLVRFSSSGSVDVTRWRAIGFADPSRAATEGLAGQGILTAYPSGSAVIAWPFLAADSIGVDPADAFVRPILAFSEPVATPAAAAFCSIQESVGQSLDSGNSLCQPSCSVVALGTTHYLYYNQMAELAAPDYSQFSLKRVCTSFGHWSGPTAVFTPSAGDEYEISLVSAKAVSSTAVGIMFQSGQAGTGNAYYTYRYPHYYQETPSCGASSPCGSGSYSVMF